MFTALVPFIFTRFQDILCRPEPAVFLQDQEKKILQVIKPGSAMGGG
jgi:hypothetical protein